MRWLLLALAGMALAATASAQVTAEVRKEIELTRKAIQTERQSIVGQAMELTDEESEPFWRLYRDWRAKVAGLGDRELKLIENFADSFESLSDEQAKEMLDEWISVDKAELKLRQEYIKKFRKILPQKKVMRFFQLENKMDAVINFELAGTIPLAQ